MDIFLAVILPLLGTALGAACVFFMRRGLDVRLEQALTGFAAGVMIAASFTSLLLPAIRQSGWMGVWAFVPAVAGLWLGLWLMRLLDRVLMQMQAQRGAEAEESPARMRMMVLAVTLHNIPEGMAVGAVCAGCIAGAGSEMAALVLALGIAVQNFPEGAIVSMPLHAAKRRGKGGAFACGVLSGAVEPLGAVLTLLAAERIVPALAYFLSFAAGAMLYVVLEELLPSLHRAKPSLSDACFPALGFALMLALDLLLG